MADQLNMNGLSLGESKHAPNGMPTGRSAYIPPHLRGSQRVPSPMGMDGAGPSPGGSNTSLSGSAWGNTNR